MHLHTADFPLYAPRPLDLSKHGSSRVFASRTQSGLFTMSQDSPKRQELFCLSASLPKLLGQVGWIITGAYSLAALPVSWLRGRMTPQQQRREIQKEIAELREQQRQLQVNLTGMDACTIRKK